ncbi:uncharacterized protein LOC130645000 [Hydractinia symbiolongicarpus]|uniref:uncharacterized protein LOC130645000 n=1 Tax=Hydractinia symbiolongicarpus TaxID=13093 RepID=UPI00254B4947|nr:uncharacterized protein LOC130645000 [Hydractinia symbiolongicarpus]
MLKHLSNRSESRNSFFTELNESCTDEASSSNQKNEEDETIINNASQEIPIKTDTETGGGISILLTKPTIRRIIERRKSELFLKETSNLPMKKAGEEETDKNLKLVEIVEEIKKKNSVITIHRRKREPNSDTSIESGIASQIGGQTVQKKIEPEEDTQIFKSSQKDFWKLENGDSAPPPIAFSSPNKVLSKLKAERKARHRSEEILNKNEIVSSEKLIGYSTLGGRVRIKPKQTTNGKSTRIEFDRMAPRNYHIGQSLTQNKRSNYIDEKPKVPTSPRPDTVGADLFRYNADNGVSSNLLSPFDPAHSDTSSLRYFNRDDKYRGSVYSISAGSSVSNIVPHTSRSYGLESSVSKMIPASQDCPCGTLNRRGILEKINEEVENNNEAFTASRERKKICERRCKYAAIFLIMLAILSCLIGGISHHYISHYPQKLVLNQGDVKLLDVSSFFCGSVTSTSEKSKVGLITFDNKEPPKHMTYKQLEIIELAPFKVWKRSFYLLKSSSINIQLTVDRSVDVMFFKTAHKYEVWSRRKQSESYSQKAVCCANRNNKIGEFLLTAEEDDTYVIAIYSSEELFSVKIEVRLTINRITYDLSHTTTSCVAQRHGSCSVDYNFNSGDQVAIEVPLDKSIKNKISSTHEVEWNCEARIWFYVVLFLGACLSVTLLILMVYFVTTKCLNPSRKCCCITTESNPQKHNFVDYYDNFGKTNSDIGAAESRYDNHGERLSSTGNHLNAMYGSNSVVTMSDSSRYIANLFEPKATTMPRLSLTNSLNRKNNNVASIYDESLNYVETADSGISVDPKLSPTSQSNINAHDLIQMQEMQFQQLKAMRPKTLHDMDLLNKAPGENKLYRPNSTTALLSNQVGELSHDLLQHRQDVINQGFSSFYNFYHTHQNNRPKRPQSVMSEGDFYKYAKRVSSTNRSLQNHQIMPCGLHYSNQVIYI